MGKLFQTSTFHCKCLYVIHLAWAWKFANELLSLQVEILTPPPFPGPLSVHFDSIPNTFQCIIFPEQYCIIYYVHFYFFTFITLYIYMDFHTNDVRKKDLTI